MGHFAHTFAHTAVAMAQLPAQSPAQAPRQPAPEPVAPRRGVRIARSRAEPKPGPALDAVVLEAVMGWQWQSVDRPDAPALRLLWNPKWGTPRCDGDVRILDESGATTGSNHAAAATPTAAGDGATGPNDASTSATEAPASAIPWDAPRPSTDPSAAYEMEAEIERRGLQYPYTVALTSIVAHTKSAQQGWENGWRLMRATPAQRCHAALRAAGYGPRV